MSGTSAARRGVAETAAWGLLLSRIFPTFIYQMRRRLKVSLGRTAHAHWVFCGLFVYIYVGQTWTPLAPTWIAVQWPPWTISKTSANHNSSTLFCYFNVKISGHFCQGAGPLYCMSYDVIQLLCNNSDSNRLPLSIVVPYVQSVFYHWWNNRDFYFLTIFVLWTTIFNDYYYFFGWRELRIIMIDFYFVSNIWNSYAVKCCWFASWCFHLAWSN